MDEIFYILTILLASYYLSLELCLIGFKKELTKHAAKEQNGTLYKNGLADFEN